MPSLTVGFKTVDYTLNALLCAIDQGELALPELQRPFVWNNAQVRDLLDSLYQGFPVGYFLFWDSGDLRAKQIGTQSKAKTARLLIVDGQQRLTSMYAVIRGKTVLDEDYQERTIQVAFRPRDAVFEVANVANRLDPEWIGNVTHLWTTESGTYDFIEDFLERLGDKAPTDKESRRQITGNIQRLADLVNYPFVALEIGGDMDEERVAEIFVRINSGGVKLNQSDFIMTLLSVFAEELRVQLETFCRVAKQPSAAGASPYNHLIQPSPDQLLRTAIAFGFRRGRLKNAYQLLRGKNLKTKESSSEERDAHIQRLTAAVADTLDLSNWHNFLNAVVGAGFRTSSLITSNTALMYAYALYLIGRKQCQVPVPVLQKLIGQWFMAAQMTERYSSRGETTIEEDLGRFEGVQDAAGFEQTLRTMMDAVLTPDYWRLTLVDDLSKSGGKSPTMLAFFAAQNKLSAPALFSTKKIHDLLDPAVKAKKSALERHHLFPQKYLPLIGVTADKEINQNANLTLLEWPENISISDQSPAEYVPEIRAKYYAGKDSDWETMLALHALPEGWETMDYKAFLGQRRLLMAEIIRKGFEAIY